MRNLEGILSRDGYRGIFISHAIGNLRATTYQIHPEALKLLLFFRWIRVRGSARPPSRILSSERETTVLSRLGEPEAS